MTVWGFWSKLRAIRRWWLLRCRFRAVHVFTHVTGLLGNALAITRSVNTLRKTPAPAPLPHVQAVTCAGFVKAGNGGARSATLRHQWPPGTLAAQCAAGYDQRPRGHGV